MELETPERRTPPLTEHARRGLLRAALAAGAWRPAPPPVPLSTAALREIAPLLLQSGEAALGWSRIRNTDAKGSEAAQQLHQAYRLNLLYAAARERDIARVFRRLRAAQIEPLMGKGWAAAQLYADRGLRPCGDIDLYVRADEFAAARAALSEAPAEAALVDLHPGFAELDDRDADDLYARSPLIVLGDTEVRTFGAEDHLRLIALHMARHGTWRPLWLCDVAAALESRPPGFDWDYLLASDRRRAEWVSAAILLAHRLVGARLDGVPASLTGRPLPRWLIPAVVRQWGRGGTVHGSRMPMIYELRHTRRILPAIRTRWPNAIEATIQVGAPLNELPRLPFQLGTCVARTARFLWTAVSQYRRWLIFY